MPSINKRINIYSKEQIDERQIGLTDDAPDQNGTLWARIKNALARIGALETADTQNVKKTGSIVTGALQVPTTPPNINSAVNQSYVESTASGVNNLVHKSGNETIAGIKTFSLLISGRLNKLMTTRSTGWTYLYDRTANRQQWLVGVSGHSLILANVQSDTKINVRVISNNDRTYPNPVLRVCKDANGKVTVWGKGSYSAPMNWYLFSNMLYGDDYTTGITIINAGGYTEPIANQPAPYDANVNITETYNSTDFEYVR